MAEITRDFTPAEIRRMLNLTIDDLAKEFGISRMTLIRRESGESDWKASEIKWLSDRSEIPIERITYRNSF